MKVYIQHSYLWGFFSTEKGISESGGVGGGVTDGGGRVSHILQEITLTDTAHTDVWWAKIQLIVLHQGLIYENENDESERVKIRNFPSDCRNLWSELEGEFTVRASYHRKAEETEVRHKLTITQQRHAICS